MKKLILKVLVGLTLVGALSACQAPTDQPSLADFVKGQERTVLDFDPNGKQPSEEEIKDMLHMAMEAPSGLNRQPFWVTAVVNWDLQQELALTPETRPQKSTVLFIYSYPENEEPSDIDMGISYAYLQFMGQAYGYGSHIYLEPAYALQEKKDYEKYGIPKGHKPAIFVLVGPSAKVDGKSSATEHTRKENFNIQK